jgi:YhcH/YjgK/YiaL family protein
VILDSLHHAGSYFISDWWDETLAYIRSATPSLPDGVYPVRGETIVARVHTGPTRPASESALESHRAYVDVHVVLDGRETVAVWPTDRLTIRAPYDDKQDVMFYDPPAEGGLRLDLSPGFFAVFFPQDAHMTQLMDQRPAAIKKLVMKISVDLIGTAPGTRGAVRILPA